MASINKRTIRWTTQSGEPRATEKYEAAYRDRAGKRHRRLFVLKKGAQRWLGEQTAGLVTGQWADPRAGRETVRAYGERWLKRQVLADSTASTYGTVLSNHIFPTLGAMRMDAINRADVQSLVKEWEGSAAARTVEARYSILAIMLRAAVKDRVIPATPCVDIKLPKIEAKSALVPISTETVLATTRPLQPRRQPGVGTTQDGVVDPDDPRRRRGPRCDQGARPGVRPPRVRAAAHHRPRHLRRHEHDPLRLAAGGEEGRHRRHAARPASLLRLGPDPWWAVDQGPARRSSATSRPSRPGTPTAT